MLALLLSIVSSVAESGAVEVDAEQRSVQGSQEEALYLYTVHSATLKERRRRMMCGSCVVYTKNERAGTLHTA
jgi:hypothetical protein